MKKTANRFKSTVFLIAFCIRAVTLCAQQEDYKRKKPPSPKKSFTIERLRSNNTLLALYEDIKNKYTSLTLVQRYLPDDRGTFKDSSMAKWFNPDGNLFVAGNSDSILFIYLGFEIIMHPSHYNSQGEIVDVTDKKDTSWVKRVWLLRDIENREKFYLHDEEKFYHQPFNESQLANGIMKLNKGTLLFFKKEK